MNKQHQIDKSHHRIIYDKCLNRCPICKKIQGRCKKFESLYQLLYHLNLHNTDDEIRAGITKDEVRGIVKHLGKALKLEMLLQ